MYMGILILDRMQRCILSDPFLLRGSNAAQNQIALTVCLFAHLAHWSVIPWPIRQSAIPRFHRYTIQPWHIGQYIT